MSVMLPPTGMGVAGMNASVTGTGDLPAKRSDGAMVKDAKVTRVYTKMLPDSIPEEAVRSTDVSKLT